MLTLIAYFALFLTLFATILAILGNHKMYWIAALGIYIFSFLAGFSIGQLTVGLTFVFLILAIGFSFNMIKNVYQQALFWGVGILIGFIMVVFVDDAWLFFPGLFLF